MLVTHARLISLGGHHHVLVHYSQNFIDVDGKPSSLAQDGDPRSKNNRTLTLINPIEKYHPALHDLPKFSILCCQFRPSIATPLVDGIVVSRNKVGTFVRQTALNLCRRKRLDNER